MPDTCRINSPLTSKLCIGIPIPPKIQFLTVNVGFRALTWSAFFMFPLALSVPKAPCFGDYFICSSDMWKNLPLSTSWLSWRSHPKYEHLLTTGVKAATASALLTQHCISWHLVPEALCLVCDHIIFYVFAIYLLQQHKHSAINRISKISRSKRMRMSKQWKVSFLDNTGYSTYIGAHREIERRLPWSIKLYFIIKKN